MKQVKKAKILTPQDLTQILAYIEQTPFAPRNRALVLITVMAGLCAKETAALLVSDVMDEQGQIKDIIHLRPEQSKNQQAHSVVISDQLKLELQRYFATYHPNTPTAPLFFTQKNAIRGFSQNTLTQHLFWLYKRSGIDASSESGKNTYRHAQSSKSRSKSPQNDVQENQEK